MVFRAYWKLNFTSKLNGNYKVLILILNNQIDRKQKAYYDKSINIFNTHCSLPPTHWDPRHRVERQRSEGFQSLEWRLHVSSGHTGECPRECSSSVWKSYWTDSNCERRAIDAERQNNRQTNSTFLEILYIPRGHLLQLISTALRRRNSHWLWGLVTSSRWPLLCV